MFRTINANSTMMAASSTARSRRCPPGLKLNASKIGLNRFGAMARTTMTIPIIHEMIRFSLLMFRFG